MKILILKPSSLGDVVQALPVLRLLKLDRPEAEVFWWIDSRLAPLLTGDPDLAGLIQFNRQRSSSPRHWPDLWRSLQSARRQAFDWVIDLQGLARSSLFAWLTNGRTLIGLDDHREGARALYDYTIARPSYHTHAVDWYKQVLRALRIPIHNRFEWIPNRPDVADVIRRKWPVAHGPWLAVFPGARWETKRWPVQNYAALVRELARRVPALRFAVLGSATDRPAGEQIQPAAPGRTLNLTGALTLPEMVEWIRLTDLVVTNDTGPMHVAAALRKPVLAIFGPTHPHRTGPYGQPENVIRVNLPCAPCGKDYCTWVRPLECLERVSVGDVLRRVLPRLAAAVPAVSIVPE